MKSFDEERTKLIEDYEAELKPIKDEMEDLKAQEITKESIFIDFNFLGHYSLLPVILGHYEWLIQHQPSSISVGTYVKIAISWVN